MELCTSYLDTLIGMTKTTNKVVSDVKFRRFKIRHSIFEDVAEAVSARLFLNVQCII